MMGYADDVEKARKLERDKLAYGSAMRIAEAQKKLEEDPVVVAMLKRREEEQKKAAEDAQWIHSVANTIEAVGGTVISVFEDVGKFVVGITLAPLRIARNIAEGQSVDKAILGVIQDDLANFKPIAQYVQVVVSFVPGIGQVASAAIAGGLALAQGRPLDEVFVAAVKNSLPGGHLTAMAFDASVAFAKGEAPEQVVLGAMPIPEEYKQNIAAALKVTRAVADGKADKMLLDEGMRMLPAVKREALKRVGKIEPVQVADALWENVNGKIPPEVDKVLKLGMAIGQAKSLQQTYSEIGSNPAAIRSWIVMAPTLLSKDAVLKSVYETLPYRGREGFEAAIGLLSKKDVTGVMIDAARKQFEGEARKAFDLALATKLGKARSVAPNAEALAKARGVPASRYAAMVKPPKAVAKTVPSKVKAKPKELAGFVVAQGLVGAPVHVKVAAIQRVAAAPEMRAGAVIAIKEIAEERKGFWLKLLEFFGLA